MSQVNTLPGNGPLAIKRTFSQKVVREAIRDNQLHQFRTFLETYTQDGKALPRNTAGAVALTPILRAAGLPLGIRYRHPGLPAVAQEYVDRVGLCSLQNFRPQPLEAAPLIRAPISATTYQQLLETPLAVSERSMAQYQSALTRFATLQNKTVMDEIGPELSTEFDQALQKLIERQYGGDARAARSTVSCLRKWQGRYAALQRVQNLPPSLDGALRQLVQEDGRTAQDLSKVIGHSVTFVTNLMIGNQRTASKATLALLEEVLDVPGGILTSRAPYYNPRISPAFCPVSRFPADLQGPEQSVRLKRKHIKKQLPEDFPARPREEQNRLFAAALQHVEAGHHLSSYGRRLAENIQLPYILNSALPERLQAEFDSVSNMKRTAGALNKPNRSLRWTAGTHGRWDREMRTFLGYCLLPTDAADERLRGPGLTLETLTLGLIVSPTLVDAYLGFRRSRTAGIDSTASQTVLISMISMLRAGSGWVSGHPELLERLPELVRLEAEQGGGWDAQCARQHRYLTELTRNTDYEVSRDTFEPIMPMIETGRPLDLVQQALCRQYDELITVEHLTHITPVQRAEMWRDHLLISLLSWLPLRAKHWPAMRYVAAHQSFYAIPNGGQLRQVEAQHWGLYLAAKDFKNVKNKSIFGPKGERDVKILLCEARGLRTVELLLDQYMRVYRPLLCPGDGPVFPDALGEPLTSARLYQIVRNWTQKYLSEHGSAQYGLRLKGVAPFGPHAFRHLMASHIVITTGSFELAANMLLDSIEMVQKHYGMFSPEHRLLSSMNQLDIWDGKREASG